VGFEAFLLNLSYVTFKNGQVIALPSPDITVVASLNDSYLPYDAGLGKEDLTLVSGTVSVTISLNNFDANFELTFTRPNGTGSAIDRPDGRLRQPFSPRGVYSRLRTIERLTPAAPSCLVALRAICVPDTQ
jgi:hypothetical protein